MNQVKQVLPIGFLNLKYTYKDILSGCVDKRNHFCNHLTLADLGMSSTIELLHI